jgi:hypothetical protein
MIKLNAERVSKRSSKDADFLVAKIEATAKSIFGFGSGSFRSVNGWITTG